jgi:hypothetical protein
MIIMKTLLIICVIFLSVIDFSFSQQKPNQPVKNPVKKSTTSTPHKAPKTSTTTKPSKSKINGSPSTAPSPVLPTTPKNEDPPKATNDENDTKLNEIEAQNKTLTKNAVSYGMERNSFTVLTVQIFVPGLGETEEKTGRPIYTPQQLFQATSLKNNAGDVLLSEKYFYNKIGFNAFGMFNQLLKDSLNMYALTGLTPNMGRSKLVKMPELSTSIGDYLTKSNVGTDILKIWTNKSILMERVKYSRAEAEKRERVDEKKLEVFGKLLKKNYVLVLALINPNRAYKKTLFEQQSLIYSTQVEGFLYHVDSTGLNPNNIKNQHPLKFIKKISMGNQMCDPRSEELVEALGGGTTVESFKEIVNTYMASTIKEQADIFFKSKAYNCAQNYYKYLLKTAEKDKDFIEKRIEECIELQRKTPSKIDTKTCLVTEESAFEDWIYAQSVTNEAMVEIETDMAEMFGTVSSIFKTKPYITAEIGKKEGLYTDQRFLVYRKTLIDGKVGEKRVGTLRIVKVADNTEKLKSFNKSNSSAKTEGFFSSLGKTFKEIIPESSNKKRDSTKTTQPKKKASPPTASQIRAKTLDSLMKKDLNTMSIFKQVDGEKLIEKDLIRQNNDVGIGVQAGLGTRFGVSGLVIGADFRLASLLKMRMPFAGVKIGANLAILDKTKLYELYGIPEDKNGLIEVYLARELYLSPILDLKPLVGLSAFNDQTYFLVGTAAYFNILGKSSNTKIRLAPEISYALGNSLQISTNLRVEF